MTDTHDANGYSQAERVALRVDVDLGKSGAADESERFVRIGFMRSHTHSSTSRRVQVRPCVMDRTIISQAAMVSRLWRTLMPGSTPCVM